ncbi:uncharacterized protein LOC128614222 isoform X4 [Ictalurus furcatus]|uniref:uncharacterized protein LOC128614222 isoform X4 n=1 Tax=Ictalurus furcatus TaxID=66913 RepID=UPI002350893D|nr:uncharacterized protein LOC128614222 isoform X4 [Ictalurus furcatus]
MHSTEVNMYQRAEIHLPRKKKVREAFRSNTYRIFDENIPERLNPDEVYKDHKYASRDPEATEALKTHNIPQPYNVKFIRTNVRFLNEPIVHMETENTKDEQSKWWLNTPDKKDPRKTAYSKESTQRRDYQPITHIPVTRVREARNKTPATGINTWASSPMLNTNPDTEMDSHCKRFICVFLELFLSRCGFPTLGPLGQPEELVEHMSFIHQYDSRRIHDQPYQGRIWAETRHVIATHHVTSSQRAFSQSHLRITVTEPLCGARGRRWGPVHSKAQRGFVRTQRGKHTI